SAEMVAQAKRLNPDISFRQGDMLDLKVPKETWAGIAAFYSIIHIPRDKTVHALAELKRVLKPGGWLLLAFHIGDQTLHFDEWWERKVCVDFHFFQPAEMVSYLKAAGFIVDEFIEREPYPDVEHPSRRAYIFASKPAPESAPKHGS